MDATVIGLYGGGALVFMSAYAWFHRRHERRARESLEETRQAGIGEPATLHPKIDPAKCIGCGSCVAACPEGRVLGLIERKAQLVDPSHCIGHGACRTACPMGAIVLVFGSEQRGVDIPHVGPDFQTNVPGIYIAGELGGMGLIRNAVEQGRQALEAIAANGRRGGGEVLDLMIVGAGPAGLAASLGALEKKLRFVTVDQETVGGTVSHFPRGKLVMTAPARLPIVGKMAFRETSKETLMAFWEDVIRRTGLKVQEKERVEAIESAGECFRIRTTRGEYRAANVLLAIGRRGTPRKLGVPGEDQSKVVYRLIDPEQYRGQHVLVVGGGDSALEAALAVGEQEGTTVTLSYRSGAFSRAKPKNRQRIEAAEAAGRVRVLFHSNVKEILPTEVVLERQGETIRLPNDAVIVCAGGILPTAFLKSIGIEVETKYGTP
ncbi:MAG: 4Fe-4S dicluster domain-containing protein [Gammaproteobacteria bacterium]|nr:MAG: 4Fe-4S dicluster domain-containing protein [Gammaproteobacteria bacterium]